ncbi:hypothetical protein ACVIHD_003783 [Bradyrhizobium embrapense]
MEKLRLRTVLGNHPHVQAVTRGESAAFPADAQCAIALRTALVLEALP